MKTQLLNYCMLNVIKYWINDILSNGYSKKKLSNINDAVDLLCEYWKPFDETKQH